MARTLIPTLAHTLTPTLVLILVLILVLWAPTIIRLAPIHILILDRTTAPMGMTAITPTTP